MKKIILAILFVLVFAQIGFGEALWTTDDIWTKVKLIGNISEVDPTFSDTAIRTTLIKEAYAWLQTSFDFAELHDLTYVDKLTLPLTTSAVIYGTEPSGFVNEIPISKIRAVRRKSTSNVEALSSSDISDLNKEFQLDKSYPKIYAFNNGQIMLNLAPTAICTLYIWANRVGNTDSVGVVGRKPPLLTIYRQVLVMKVVSLAKGKQGNYVAEENCGNIAESMLAFAYHLQAIIQNERDINLLPRVYEE